MSVREDAVAMHGELAQLRHALHAEPEIGLALPRTQERVLDALDGLGLELTTGVGTTSVTGVLRGTGNGPTVLLRGDMDALPVQEKTGVAYTSRVEQRMHACGHDLHTTMLVGAARLLAAHRDRLGGDVVFMFQPGEEGYDGAAVMIDEGILDAAGRRVDAAYGMHVLSSGLPHGVFGTRQGSLLAAMDAVRIQVHGPGGHGSKPHQTPDPVTAICAMVPALQTMIARQFDVFDPVVCSVGSLHAGTKGNTIPETAWFEATVRTCSQEARERIQERIPTVLRGIAAAHRVDVEIDYEPGYPPTVTDEAETELAAAVIGEHFGTERHTRLPNPLLAAEDFSRVLGQVPGSYVILGAAPHGRDADAAAYNHSPFAEFDDAVLPDGAALYAELAIARTSKPKIS